jgi:hypothetical protein
MTRLATDRTEISVTFYIPKDDGCCAGNCGGCCDGCCDSGCSGSGCVQDGWAMEYTNIRNAKDCVDWSSDSLQRRDGGCNPGDFFEVKDTFTNGKHIRTYWAKHVYDSIDGTRWFDHCLETEGDYHGCREWSTKDVYNNYEESGRLTNKFSYDT